LRLKFPPVLLKAVALCPNRSLLRSELLREGQTIGFPSWLNTPLPF